MRVEDVMTVEVHSVRSETTLKEAAAILAREGISGLPVVDAENRVIGVLSEGDILFKERGVEERKRWFDYPQPENSAKLRARTVGEAMSAPAVTIGSKRPLAEAAAAMIDEGIKRLPVVDDQRRVIGIVARADLVRAFVRSDEEITEDIREEVIFRALWIAPDSVEVVVENGEVRLSGEVETKTDAEMIPALVQRVPGVVSVLSKLRWPDEKTGKVGARPA